MKRHRLDAQIRLAWANLQRAGIHFIRATKIKRRIACVKIRRKSGKMAGLQLAD
jgi:hypothetical protein